MAFARKILLGIDTLKAWCEQTFASKSHGTHVTTSTCVTSVNGQKGDVTISNSLPDISISDVNGLRQELDGKAASSHGTHVSASTCVTSINGQTGAITIDSSGNYSPEDHHHNISDVDGLQTALNGKAPLSHGTHVTTTTCVTSVNGQKGDITIATGSTGIGFPDYASGSNITADFKSSSTHDGANRYIPNKNGWIVCTPQSKVYVNGSSLYVAHNGDAGLTNDSIFPVKSGDIVTGGASSMYFFPMR